MGVPTGFLQEQFASRCPRGWRCRAEGRLVDKASARRLGHEPKAEVLLERIDHSQFRNARSSKAAVLAETTHSR